MLEVSQSAREYVVTTRSLQLVFEQIGDRWQHRILRLGRNFSQLAFTSWEGTPDQAIPPSPAFQDLRLEQIDDQTQEFQLLGQSGKQIYSAAIRIDGEINLIDFDICARSQKKDVAANAFSTYRLESPWNSSASIGNEGTAMRLSCAGHELTVAGEPISGQLPLLEWVSKEAPMMFKITAREQSGGPIRSPSQSIRWRYRISGVPSA